MIQLLIDIILLFIFDFDLPKKMFNFYFPFSLYKNCKKSRGDYQLMVASLIVVCDVLLKSFSLIAQLWLVILMMIYYFKFNVLKTQLFFISVWYNHNWAIRENDFNNTSHTTINDTTINW